MANTQVDKSLLVALVTAVLTLTMSLGGAWIVTEKTLAVQGSKLEVMEGAVQELKNAVDKMSIVTQNVQVVTRQVDKQEIQFRSIENKVNNLEVTSARSVIALENLANAVQVLSVNTNELIKTNNGLAVIVGRLEERTK